MDAIRENKPFYCHEHLSTKPNGEWYYDPTLPPPSRCRGWEAIAAHPETKGAAFTAIKGLGPVPTSIQASGTAAMKHNPNKGTPRGRKAIRASPVTYGAGRSIVVDRVDVVTRGQLRHRRLFPERLPRYCYLQLNRVAPSLS